MTDPYELLEVNKSASLVEIKKSYRKLAKKFHPDFNPGNKEAEKKFKTIQHAFDLIGTEDAKAKWDRGETDEQKQQQHDEFTRNRKNGERPFYYNSQDQGGRYSYSFGDDLGGGEEIFESLFGSRHGRRGGSARFAGEDATYQMEVEFREAALGGEKVISLPNGKSLQVKIPAGIEAGKKLKFKGMGGSGINGGPSGDAYVEIKVKPLSGFERKGKDIMTELDISFIEALLGGEIRVQTLDGSVMLKIPPGVSTDSKLRIKGKGAGPESDRGNQLVLLKVVMPRDPSPELQESIRRLKDSFEYNPRSMNEQKEYSRDL